MATTRYVEPEYDGPALSAHDKQYIGIGLLLAVLTAVEVGLYFVEKNGTISGTTNTWTLLVLAFIKFSVVAGYFMHLKLDNPIFKRLFVVGAVLAGFCYIAVLIAFGVFPNALVAWLAYGGFAIAAATLALRGGGTGEHDEHDGHDHSDHAHAH
jgi:cytochrome c oxidase subunit IV